MTDQTEHSNVVWLDRRRRARVQDTVSNLEAELTRERGLLERLKAIGADVDDHQRCVELTQAMLAIARA